MHTGKYYDKTVTNTNIKKNKNGFSKSSSVCKVIFIKILVSYNREVDHWYNFTFAHLVWMFSEWKLLCWLGLTGWN